MSLSDILTAHADVFRQKTGANSKLSITDMTSLTNSLSWSQPNLLKGTSDQYRDINVSGWGWVSTSTDSLDFGAAAYHGGKVLTYSATITNKTNESFNLEVMPQDINGYNQTWLCQKSQICESGDVDKEMTASIKVNKSTSKIRFSIVKTNLDPSTQTIQVKDERLFIGVAPGFWTPNPTDKVGGGN